MNKIKTEMTVNVKIMNEVKVLPVYKIPVEDLYFNDRNDRIASFINEFSEKLNNLSDDGKNNEIEEFIVKSNEPAYKTTYKSIKDDTQLKPGIVASDGRVLDGNRRFTCLRKLNRKFPNSKYGYFLAAVLDGEWEALSAKEIKKIEYNLQFAEEERVGYDTVDILVGIYNNVILGELNEEQEPVLTIKEYCESKKVKRREFDKDKRALEMMIEYLEYINQPKHFYIARDNKLKEALSTIAEGINKISAKDDDKENLKYLCFDILVTNANLHVSLTHTINKLIKGYKSNKEQYSQVIEESEELAEKIFDEVVGDEGFSKHKQDKFMKSRTNAIFRDSIASLLETNETINIKDKPLSDIKAALNKIRKVDLGIVRTYGDDMNNEFVGYLNSISDEIDRIKGEFDVKL